VAPTVETRVAQMVAQMAAPTAEARGARAGAERAAAAAAARAATGAGRLAVAEVGAMEEKGAVKLAVAVAVEGAAAVVADSQVLGAMAAAPSAATVAAVAAREAAGMRVGARLAVHQERGTRAEEESRAVGPMVEALAVEDVVAEGRRGVGVTAA
jgi:hypothetical protein